jgi:hypothetical protein
VKPTFTSPLLRGSGIMYSISVRNSIASLPWDRGGGALDGEMALRNKGEPRLSPLWVERVTTARYGRRYGGTDRLVAPKTGTQNDRMRRGGRGGWAIRWEDGSSIRMLCTMMGYGA